MNTAKNSNKFENDAPTKYERARGMSDLTKLWGNDPDYGLPITPDGDFPFDGGEAQLARPVQFEMSKSSPFPKIRNSAPEPGKL